MLTPLLRRSAFRWFLTGELVSLLGSSMAPVALAFAVLDASGSTGDLGVVLTSRMVPLLVFLLVGGATADRFPRRTVLVCANLGSALTQGTVAWLLLTGRYALPPVAGLELLNGVLTAFTTPALRGLLPELVGQEQLRQANALLGSVRNATKILGPSLSGVLVVAAGGGAAIAVDAASYLVAAGCLARLSLAGRPAPPQGAGLLTGIREGWAEYRSIPWVWRVSVAFCVFNLVMTGPWQILGPALTEQAGSKATWGFVLSARGLGLLVMSALMYRLVVGHLLRLGLLMCVLIPLPLLLLGARLPAPWLIAGAFLAGLGSSAMVVGWDTSLQEHVPADVLSRVASYDDLLSYLAIPVGQLCVGPLAQAFGGFRVAEAAAVAAASAAVAPLASRAVRRLPHGRPATPAPTAGGTPQDARQPAAD